jgi:L-threonylcarbamoyladenylate synthase
MDTVVERIDPDSPDPAAIARAAALLRAGGVVAFPTETVYGLGADALATESVRKIFAAKGRPANNPVIVHVTDTAEARRLATTWPAAAALLADSFWPGPLTLVLPKADVVPAITTADGPTVALRVPAHPTARALIAATGRPLAAPSANLSTRVSATRAEHVLKGLSGRIEMVLDGGATPGGLESTVVDVSGPTPRLLRHGLIDVVTLRELLDGRLEVVDRRAAETDTGLASPGMLLKHYSPAVPLELTDDDGRILSEQFANEGLRVGWITCGRREAPTPADDRIVQVDLGNDPTEYARRLYDTLHALEATGVERIVVSRPPPAPGWDAIQDRLSRAAAR